MSSIQPLASAGQALCPVMLRMRGKVVGRAMATKNRKASLESARKTKNDEFYTQWVDIEREINAYLEYDPDVFRGKTLLLPCDDPEWSNFTKFFALHFTEYGLKKLISTSFAPDNNPAIREVYQPTLFETESPKFDSSKSRANGKKFVLEANDLNADGKIDYDDLDWDYLSGNGDFRSDEVSKLRDEADMVITNPPFSLFREFIDWLAAGDVQFSVIGNVNAITYKETFPRIQRNKMWLGATHFNTGMYFHVPDGFTYAPTYKFERERDGKAVSRVPGVCWFTNIEHGRRHEPIELMTEADNLRFNKKIDGTPYQKYTNYEAIEVPFTNAIPADYEGAMGVPITFLDKYNPEQFEILGSSMDLSKPISQFAEKGTYPQGGPAFHIPTADGQQKRLYYRIVIRHLKSEGNALREN